MGKHARESKKAVALFMLNETNAKMADVVEKTGMSKRTLQRLNARFKQQTEAEKKLYEEYNS